MNSKATKAALITSLTSLVLCFTMLMGTTLAWFVDRVESTNNRIEAGNLEVDLVMYNKATGNYVSIANLDPDVDLFTLATGNSNAWSPGASNTIYFGIRNMGSLPVKYDAKITVSDTDTNDGINLANVLYYVVAENIGQGVAVKGTSISLSGKSEISIAEGKVLEEIAKDPTNEDKQNETHYYALKLSMSPDASMDYCLKSVKIDISVNATQLNFDESTNGETVALYGISDDERVETLSATSWKLKAEVADFSFLEKTEDKDESEDIIFPEETAISDGENTYPLSELRVIPLDEVKLLAAVPLEKTEKTNNSETEAEKKAPTEKVFIYYPKADETDEASMCGWYLIAYEDFQALVSDGETDTDGLFASKNKIIEEESLPVITFPEDEDAVLKNTDIIGWLYESAELLPATQSIADETE